MEFLNDIDKNNAYQSSLLVAAFGVNFVDINGADADFGGICIFVVSSARPGVSLRAVATATASEPTTFFHPKRRPLRRLLPGSTTPNAGAAGLLFLKGAQMSAPLNRGYSVTVICIPADTLGVTRSLISPACITS